MAIWYNLEFDQWKSSLQHHIRSKGEIKALEEMLREDVVTVEFNKKNYCKALYALAMIDYLSAKNNIPLCSEYSEYRKLKLQEPVFPTSAKMDLEVTGMTEEKVIKKYMEGAEPMFLKYGIVEGELFDIG